jgi:hypothetical protein
MREGGDARIAPSVESVAQAVRRNALRDLEAVSVRYC